MKTFYYLYKITNHINGKIYVGVHQSDSLYDGYMGSGKLLKRAQDKYGIENFTKEILDTFDSAEAMYKAESIVVNESFVLREDTYNIKQGGHGGWDHVNDGSLEHIERCRRNANNTAKKVRQRFDTDPAFKEKFAETSKQNMKARWEDGIFANNNQCTFKGKHHTEETKQKMSDARKGQHAGKKNPMYGTMYIYNKDLKESKRIPKDDPIPDGWIKGRKMKF